jgi:hypothetical protein
MGLEITPPGPQTRDVFGGWLEIAQMVARFVSQLPGLGGAPVVVDLLGVLADAQDGQTALLKSIKADTAALRVAPWKEAVESLADARRVGPTDPSWGRFLDRAEAKLSEARQLVSDMREAALVEYDLGMVWLFIGHEVNARYHLQESVQCANQAVNEYVLKARTWIRDERPDGLKRGKLPEDVLQIGSSLRDMATLGIWKATAGRARDKACRDLKDFTSFYNLIQDTVGRLSGDAKPRYLAVHRVYKPNPKEPGLTRRERQKREAYANELPFYTLRLR